MQVVVSTEVPLCIFPLSYFLISLYGKPPPLIHTPRWQPSQLRKGERCTPRFPTPHRVGLFVSLIERRISKQLLSAGINGKRSEWSVTELLAFLVLWIWRALWHSQQMLLGTPSMQWRQRRAGAIRTEKQETFAAISPALDVVSKNVEGLPLWWQQGISSPGTKLQSCHLWINVDSNACRRTARQNNRFS